MIVRRVGLGVAVAVTVAALSLGIATWLTRTSGPPVRIGSDEGGFSVAVPRGWSVEKRRPTEGHDDFLVGHENAAFGFLRRGGFWIARWAVATDASIKTVRARLASEQEESPRDNWTLDETRIAGRSALVRTFTESPPDFGGRLRLGHRTTVTYELLVSGFNYQVGLWTLPHAGGVTAALDKLAASIEFFAPRAWTAELDGTDARLTLPGGWTQRPTDLDGAIFFAIAPSDPTEAWAYVFRYDGSTRASVRNARRSISANDGTIIDQLESVLAGRPATRLDFTFPDEGHPPARGVEWFVGDGEGGTFVLAVGRRSGAANIAERVASGWRF